MGQPDIDRRTYDFSLRIVNLCRALEKDRVSQVLMRQVLRSGTSIGANVREAQGGQSKKVVYDLPQEFVSKGEIVLNQQPVTARFELVPLAPEPGPSPGP